MPRRGSRPPPPSADARETTVLLLEKRADVARFPRREGVGVHLKASGQNKNSRKIVRETSGAGGGQRSAGSVLIDSRQRENSQVCRKITSFPIPMAPSCDSCFLGDSKMPGFS